MAEPVAGPPPDAAVLGEVDFERLAEVVEGRYGLQMPPSKREHVEQRLRKRVRALGLASFTDYLDHVFAPRGLREELGPMLDALCTNKTEFFRVPEQETHFAKALLPGLCPPGRRAPLALWSAGCSTGEEPYGFGLVLAERARTEGGPDWWILGTDLSGRALETARRAVYPEAAVARIPEALRRRWLLRSRERVEGRCRIAPAVRERVSFRRRNLLDPAPDVPLDLDVVVCRNALIYFDRPVQHRVLAELCTHLRPGGLLLLGPSETVRDLDLPLDHAGPFTWRKRGRAP